VVSPVILKVEPLNCKFGSPAIVPATPVAEMI